jgi:hypothetical protein
MFAVDLIIKREINSKWHSLLVIVPKFIVLPVLA